MASVTGSGLLDVVHRRDGFLRILLIGVAHKPEPPTAAGIAVLDNHLSSEMLDSAHSILIRGDARGLRPLAPETRSLRNEVEANERALQHTASSTTPNSSNFCLNVVSSVCHARPLLPR